MINNIEGIAVKHKSITGIPRTEILFKLIIPSSVIMLRIIPAYEIKTLATRLIHPPLRLFDHNSIARNAAIPPSTNFTHQIII